MTVSKKKDTNARGVKKPLASSHNTLINKVNSLMEKFILGIDPVSYLTFGQDFSTCTDSQLVHESLIIHRILNKWQRPDNSVTDRLKTECFDNWLAHEGRLRTMTALADNCFRLSPEHWKGASLARDWLKPVVRSLHQLYEGNFHFDVDIEFTPGETYESAAGKVSVKQKLLVEKWTVSWNNLPRSIKLVMNHFALREVAAFKLLKYCKGGYVQRLFQDVCLGLKTQDEMFYLMIEKYLFTVVNGARASSVEKNNKVRRFINIEPLFDMLLQRLVGLLVRKALGKTNDLQTGQRIHRQLISISCYSTIDLRNASDSNVFIFAERYVKTSCPILWQCIQSFRSCTTTLTYPCGKVIEEVNYKVSSMGNGFTFELMTLILLSQARVYDPTARVYGDDIIIKNDYAHTFINLIRKTGWEVNTSKTFINSKFRESCGGFYHDDLGDLVSFDFHFCENLQDVFVTCNKLRLIIAQANELWQHSDLLDALIKLHASLVGVIPAEHKGPTRAALVPQFNIRKSKNWWLDSAHNDSINCDYVEVDKPCNAYKHSKVSRALYQKSKPLIDWCKSQSYIQTRTLGVVKVPRYKPRLASRHSRDNLDLISYMASLYSGTAIKDVIRGKGNWSEITCVICEDGYLLPLATLRKWRQVHLNYNACGPKPRCYYSPLVNWRYNIVNSHWTPVSRSVMPQLAR